MHQTFQKMSNPYNRHFHLSSRCILYINQVEIRNSNDQMEPNRTLQGIHSVGGLPMFGELMITLNNERLNVGGQIVVVRRKPFAFQTTE